MALDIEIFKMLLTPTLQKIARQAGVTITTTDIDTFYNDNLVTLSALTDGSIFDRSVSLWKTQLNI